MDLNQADQLINWDKSPNSKITSRIFKLKIMEVYSEVDQIVIKQGGAIV